MHYGKIEISTQFIGKERVAAIIADILSDTPPPPPRTARAGGAY